MDPDKKELRKLKRQIKKKGNKRRRQHFKQDLQDNPDEAHRSDYQFEKFSSESMNGMDDDAKRRKGN